MAQLCQILRPWECVPFMCGFQSPGQGFFYIPDSCTAKQLKERATSVVITVIEGEASVKELEDAFFLLYWDKMAPHSPPYRP